MDMKLFNNPKPVVFAIIAILLLFFAYKAKATEVEVGPTFTGQFNGGVGITLMERMLDNNIDVGVALIGDQEWNGRTTANNGNVFAAFVASKPETWHWAFPTEVTIGAAYWIKTDDRLIGSELGYQLGLKWRFNEHASIGIRHWSNAGTVKPNRGQDLLTFGWSF